MAIAHLTLPTRDLRRTVAFFEGAMGWRRLERPGNIAVPAAWLQIAPGQELHLVQVADFEPSPFEREYGRHIAVSYPASGFVDLKTRLQTEGAEIIAPLRETSFKRFFFRSPDGYIIEVLDHESHE